MHGLATAARWGMVILLGGLMAVVLGKLFTGGIPMSGLLTSKDQKSKDRTSKDNTSSFSPGRAQMLMATVLTAMYYLIQVISNPSIHELPALPASLVGILGGSHAVYLGAKAWTLFAGKPDNHPK